MISLLKEHKRGWAWPINSRKAHYFVNAYSLCGRWMYLGSLLNDDNHNSPDNCRDCTRKRLKRKTDND